jgi:energy-coupling factor transporter ATP-binding protein EcfA2
MYECLRVENLRGLRSLAIEDLGRINLLVGANNVGKTTVLEALALLHAHRNGYEVRQIVDARGYADDTGAYGALAGLFGPWDCGTGERGFLIAAQHAQRGWSVALGSPSRLPTDEDLLGGRGFGSLRFGPSIAFTLGEVPEHLYIQYFLDSRRARSTVSDKSADVTLDLALAPDPADGAGGGFFGEAVYLPATTALRRNHLPSLLTQLRRSGRFPSVLQTLRQFDPRLLDIAPAVDRGQVTVDVTMGLDGDRQVAVPIASLGGGLQRLWDLLVSMGALVDGAVLVDEIESGIYFDSLPALWATIRESAQRTESQIFATTHSWEGVGTAVEAFRAAPDEFRLHRLERQGDDVVAVTYRHDVALAAVSGRTELR